MFSSRPLPPNLVSYTSRLFRYVTSHLLVKAMKPIGHICAAASYANPELNLRRFVPFLSDRIIDTAQNHEGDEGVSVLPFPFLYSQANFGRRFRLIRSALAFERDHHIGELSNR